jgi:putative glycosyltransferase (TIGR04372 family)
MPADAAHSSHRTTAAQSRPYPWWEYLNQGFPVGDYLARKTETLLLIPLAIILSPVSLVLLRSGVHVWPIFSERLGHQCLESDCAIRCSRSQGKTRRILLVSRRQKLANKSFFDGLPPGTSHLEGRLAFACAVALTYFNLYRKARSFCRLPTARQTHRAILSSTPPAFVMGESHRTASRRLLKKLLQDSQLRVELHESTTYCVFNFRHPYPDIAGDQLQAQRYSSATHLNAALRYLRDIGIVPVLTGAPPKQETDCLPLDLYVNYAASQWKSDSNDVLLCGNAAFCLGSTSGLTLLSSVFGVPCVIHNQVPYKDYWYSDLDLIVPKLMREKASGALIPYRKEVVESALMSRYIVDSPDVPYVFEECAEEDILAATVEMCIQLNLVPGRPPVRRRNTCGSVSSSFRHKYAEYLPVSA